jgi:hypothetical protein
VAPRLPVRSLEIQIGPSDVDGQRSKSPAPAFVTIVLAPRAAAVLSLVLEPELMILDVFGR